MSEIEPIFIISMPRAGSTLLQRLLMGHPSIDSCGEPWLALPLVYMLRGQGAMADYGHQSAARSIQEFVSELPGGETGFLHLTADFLRALYTARASEIATFFVDKTPRYYKILPELRRMFPESPALFLLRNPLAVFGSIINFVDGDLRYLPMWESDWLEGHAKISDAVASEEYFHLVRFESLVSEPHHEVKTIIEKLGLSFDPALVDEVAGQRLNRGDPTGVKRYNQVDKTPLTSWKGSINTATRKRLALKWLRALPEAQWHIMGYDREATLGELLSHHPEKGWKLMESISLFIGRIYFYSRIHLLRKAFRKGGNGHRPFYN